MIACCVDSADEVILTEMIFDDSFKNLAPEEVPAFVSCFLDLRKGKGDVQMTKNTKLKEAFGKLRTKVQDFINVQQECGVEIDADKYMESFRPDMMEPILAWCQGKPFKEVVELANMFEGQVIRNTRRVEDILRQMMDAVKAIGNSELVELCKKAIILLRHGIAFSTSLYVQDDNKEEEDSEEYGYIPEQFIDERFKSQIADLSDDEVIDGFLEDMAFGNNMEVEEVDKPVATEGGDMENENDEMELEDKNVQQESQSGSAEGEVLNQEEMGDFLKNMQEEENAEQDGNSDVELNEEEVGDFLNSMIQEID